MFLAFPADHISFIDVFKLFRVQAGNNFIFQVSVFCRFKEAFIRYQAGIAVFNLNAPRPALCLTFADERDHIFTAERLDAEQFVSKCDAVTAVADHVLKTELPHIRQRHPLRAAGGDGRKVAGLLQLPERQFGRFRHIAGIAAGQQSSVNIKKDILLFSHSV